MDDVERQLLEAVIQNPDDEDAREIYADWLEERADPRGEYLRLETQLLRIPARLTALSEAIEPDWIEAVARLYDVWLQATGPNKIAVIKEVRALTGLGLRDAVQLVDALAKPQLLRHRATRDQALASATKLVDAGARVEVVPHRLRPDAAPIVIDCVLARVVPDEHVRAIKLVRELTGLGLRDAKDAVDRVAAGTPFVIAHGVDGARATEIAARFSGIALIENRRR